MNTRWPERHIQLPLLVYSTIHFEEIVLTFLSLFNCFRYSRISALPAYQSMYSKEDLQ